MICRMREWQPYIPFWCIYICMSLSSYGSRSSKRVEKNFVNKQKPFLDCTQTNRAWKLYMPPMGKYLSGPWPLACPVSYIFSRSLEKFPVSTYYRVKVVLFSFLPSFLLPRLPPPAPSSFPPFLSLPSPLFPLPHFFPSLVLLGAEWWWCSSRIRETV